MQANRFDRAAEAPILNTYVPINFGELYRIGAAQKQAVDEAAQQFNAQLQKFGEFSSISDVDVQDYRDSSLGKMQNLINEAVTNPDAMKDASFRARFYSGLNSIDYFHLANLRKSAENMDTREKAKAALRAQGLYADWFDDPKYSDLRNWSTRDSGIMTNISPDKYIGMEELGKEYVKDLKPTFYKGKAPNSGAVMPFTNWMAISRADVRRSLNDHADDILSTTAGQRHFDRFTQMYKNMNPNASYDEVRASFIDALTTEQSDKMIETPVVDQASLSLELKNREYKAKNAGKNNKDALPFIYPSDLHSIQSSALSRKAESTQYMNPEIKKTIETDDIMDAQKIKSMYGEFASNPVTAEIMSEQLKILVQNGNISEQDIVNGDIDVGLLDTMMNIATSALSKNDPLKTQYDNMRTSILNNAKKHTQMLSNELIYSTLRSYLNIKDSSVNPMNAVFDEVSNNVLNAVDAAVSASMGDLNLNKPDQDIILESVFGRDKNDGKIRTQTKDFSLARSSFDYLYENYDTFRNDAEIAAKNKNYSKENVKKNITLIANVDPTGFGDYDMLSLRNNVANGVYGNVQITGLDGYTPVQGSDPNEYAFQVRVRVPVDKINETTSWWQANYTTPEMQKYEGLQGETIKEVVRNKDGDIVTEDVDYVEVPIVINKSIPRATKLRLDALYRQQINATTELSKANEQQTATQSPQTTMWLNLGK